MSDDVALNPRCPRHQHITVDLRGCRRRSRSRTKERRQLYARSCHDGGDGGGPWYFGGDAWHGILRIPLDLVACTLRTHTCLRAAPLRTSAIPSSRAGFVWLRAWIRRRIVTRMWRCERLGMGIQPDDVAMTCFWRERGDAARAAVALDCCLSTFDVHPYRSLIPLRRRDPGRCASAIGSLDAPWVEGMRNAILADSAVLSCRPGSQASDVVLWSPLRSLRSRFRGWPLRSASRSGHLG